MPRLRNPSLKVRENLGFSSPASTSGKTTRNTTPSQAEPSIPLTKPISIKASASVKTPGTKKKGRPRSVKNTKALGRPKRSKVKYAEDIEAYGYEYDSRSSSSSEDEAEYVTKPGPADFFDEEEIDEHGSPNSKHDAANDEDDDIMCPWIDDNIPALVLPESSSDIPAVKEHIMDLIEIYEILRCFYRTLRLSPFIFEDFCAAMSSPENSCILSEIHIALLKACLRSDDEEQVHYSVNDTNNAVNITFYAIDSMTYAEVLRLYLESDRAKNRVPQEILNAINTPNYPFVGIDIRGSVITYLCYRFLDLTEFKKIVINNGKFIQEDICRGCLKGGDLLHCDNCELSFHPNCNKIEENDSNVFICGLCRINEVKGVHGCEPLDQTGNKQPLRMTPIGRDRHGRIYWFVARRLIIQNDMENTLTYYSTAPQLYELVSVLDPSYFEYDLCKTLCDHLAEILEQMAVTLELTSERLDIIRNEQVVKNKLVPEQAHLHVDNIVRMKKILLKIAHKENIQIHEEDPEYEPLPARMEPLLGIGSEGNLLNNFWAGHIEENEVINYDIAETKDFSGYFALGHLKYDDQFRKYKNNYTAHEYGEPLATKKKASDKKKYMSTRFSLLDDGDDAFRWSIARGKDMYGPERQHAKYLEWTINKLQKRIPIEMMHRRWTEVSDEWRIELSKAETFDALASCLLKFEASMRRTLFLSQFWSSLGLTRWTRTTPDDREQASKENQRRKKEEKDISSADYDDVDFIRVKYTRLPSKACPQTLWRMKDETYRLGGKGSLGGWLWVSSTMVREWQPLPEKPPIGCINSFATEKTVVVKKAHRLESIIKKLTAWRKTEEEIKSRNKIRACYSPTCQRALLSQLVCTKDSIKQSCYSFDCQNNKGNLSIDLTDTKIIAKAHDITIFPKPQEIRGEGDLMWPLLLPTVFYSKRNKKRSILRIHPIILKKLARTGGHQQIYVPNFSLSAKSNFSLWNYPCPRPCFDLCWKWLTTNARSLHAVSLQLKILWFCIKWAEFMPGEDETEDGRLIVHQPDRDEIRLVIAHKEFPPQGTYERYLLQIEAVMLDEEPDDDDYERSSSTRKKPISTRPKRAVTKLSRKTTRQEWIDGIELKIFEIRSYWERVGSRVSNQFNKLIFTKDYITAKDLYLMNNRNLSSRSPFVPGIHRNTYSYETTPSGISSLQRARRVVLPRRDSNFAYDDNEFDNMEQSVYSSTEPPMKKARVILQPGVSVGNIGRPSNFYERPSSGYIATNGSSIRPSQIVSDASRSIRVGPGTSQIITNASSRVIPRVVAGGSPEERSLIRNGNYQSSSSIAPTSTNSYSNATRQIVYSQRPGSAGKLLLVRKNDGTTQYLRPIIRPASNGSTPGVANSPQQHSQPVRRIIEPNLSQSGDSIRHYPNTTRLIKIGPNGEQHVQIIPAGTRIIQRNPAMADTRPTSSNLQQSTPIIRTVRVNGNSSIGVPMRQNMQQQQPSQSQALPNYNGSSVRRIAQVRQVAPAANQSSSRPAPTSNEMDFDENFLEPPPETENSEFNNSLS